MTNIDSLLFKIEMTRHTPYLGALLISEPFLREEYFCHSVICLIDYKLGNSTMGIVMNKKTKYQLNDLIPDIYSQFDIPIFCGGPLSNDRLYYIHSLGDIITDSKKILDGLYIGGDFNDIIEYINSGNEINGKIRFFIGYSGWDPGQLEDEIKNHVWAVTPSQCNLNLLHGDGDKYWHRYVKIMGEEYNGWKYHPETPSLN